mmetsp:Transcript_83009/g.231713  ORF Transcript_83009/g.231713 Transcript_83009/m.231713 type:complete len:262 (+) Transcript_83009:356-1141(+)
MRQPCPSHNKRNISSSSRRALALELRTTSNMNVRPCQPLGPPPDCGPNIGWVAKRSQHVGTCSRSNVLGYSFTESTSTTSILRPAICGANSFMMSSNETMETAITHTSRPSSKNASALLNGKYFLTPMRSAISAWSERDIANTSLSSENVLARNCPNGPKPTMPIRIRCDLSKSCFLLRTASNWRCNVNSLAFNPRNVVLVLASALCKLSLFSSPSAASTTLLVLRCDNKPLHFIAVEPTSTPETDCDTDSSHCLLRADTP